MAPEIEVRVAGREPLRVPVGTTVRDLPGSETDAAGLRHLGALVNNDAVTLTYPLEVDCDVELLTIRHPQGWRIYRNSVAFLLAKTVRELHPAAEFAVEHSLGTGFYCRFALDGRSGATAERCAAIEARMHETARADRPIERRKVAFAQAMTAFEAEGQRDKYDLLRFRNPPKVVVYECEGFTDLAHGVLADRTGALDHFRIIAHPPGFVLQLPDRDRAPEIAPFDPQPQLFRIFQEHKEWGRILGLRTVGDLNRLIADGEIHDLVRIAEAFHEKKIAEIADHIHRHRDRLRWVLIAGPSSSGKTTFVKRLAVQLRVNGLRTAGLSVDNYFVDRARTPRDESGAYDFEHLDAVDLDLLGEHLRALDEGREIELPVFDFGTGARTFRGERLRRDGDQIVLIEGIHALNPRLTAAVPSERKFRVYISALTQLNLDCHNRIATTDNRLLRRLVRDRLFRGHDARRTLEMWPSVRRGEKRWVFPYQGEADVAFNSALDYELAVLKPMAEPLLTEVKPFHAPYAEARRLMEFLGSFLTVSAALVPPNSILREFIGRSSFRY
jgi:uridine kinase